MIQYALKCTEGHSFDSWFQSAGAFDKLARAGMISCVICGGTQVEKAIMTPRVRPARKAVSSDPAPQDQTSQPVAGSLSPPASELEKAVSELRKQVEANADYVGDDFVSQARAMHSGETPTRSIYGEAKVEDAKALIEEGVSVAPLPFRPNRKTN